MPRCPECGHRGVRAPISRIVLKNILFSIFHVTVMSHFSILDYFNLYIHRPDKFYLKQTGIRASGHLGVRAPNSRDRRF